MIFAPVGRNVDRLDLLGKLPRCHGLEHGNKLETKVETLLEAKASPYTIGVSADTKVAQSAF